MDIRISKVREWIDEGALVTKYCNALSTWLPTSGQRPSERNSSCSAET
jgi:hypothetical protein